MMRVAVVTFPGSNCDQDTLWALKQLGAEPVPVWYTQTSLGHVDRVILPGGFSYGDYLRSGALAAQAPIMADIERRIIDEALPVLGICNGFQILTERGLLPGALRTNPDGKFRCSWQTLRVATASALFTGLEPGTLLRMPIAHREGSYFAPPEQLAELWRGGSVLLQYATSDGQVTLSANPNGSEDNIAGVIHGSVAGLMPHPERAMVSYLGSEDGRRFLRAWLGEAS